MREEQEALVRRLVEEVINGNRPEIIDELFSPELAEPVRRAFASFRAAFPDWREEIVELVAEGERLAVRFRCSGSFTGSEEFLGGRPNGGRQEVSEVFFLSVRGGRIVDYWGIEDNLERLRQLGLIAR